MARGTLWTCLLVVTMVVTCWVAAQAQSGEDVIQVTRASLQADRLTVVAAAMKLTDSEADGFWPLYREYRSEIEKQNDILVSMTKQFLQDYDTLTDDQATKMLTSWLDAESARRYIQRKYVGRFLKVLPPKKVARFYQVENKLDAIVRYEFVGEMPLAK